MEAVLGKIGSVLLGVGGIAVELIVLLVVIIIASIRRRDDFVNVDSATRQEIDSTIKTGRRLTLAMRQASHRLMQVEIKKEIEGLCKIAESMFEMLRKDPNDLRIVKQFITYYLEPTHKIVLKYVELATTRPMPADAVSILDKTEKSFKSIRTAFLQQKEKMLANDVMDLDTEIKVFETISRNMSMDGDSGKDKNPPPVSTSGQK